VTPSATVPAEVSFVESLGSSTQAYFEMPGAEDGFSCQLDGRVRPQRGQTLALHLAAVELAAEAVFGAGHLEVGLRAAAQ
jgi:hypothetical protein